MNENYQMTRTRLLIAGARMAGSGLLIALSSSAVFAQGDGADGDCGIDRLCMTPAVQALISSELSHQKRAENLRRNLELETLRAEISQRKAEQAPDEPPMGSATQVIPPPAPPADVTFPGAGAPSGSVAQFPFPPDAMEGESSGAPFEVAGVGNGRAVVRVNGTPRLVSVGDDVSVGKIKEITFDGVVVSHKGSTKRYSVSW